MKRIYLLLLLSPTLAKAEGFADTWKKINEHRVTSAVKATATGVLGYYAVHAGMNVMPAFSHRVETFNPDEKLLSKLHVNAAFTVGTGAAFYVAYQLLWNNCRAYAMHALLGRK